MIKKTLLVAAVCVLVGCGMFAGVRAATTIGLVSDGEGSAGMTADLNQLLLQKLSGWTIDAVSWQGDIAYGGSVASALQSYASSTASAIPLFLVAGNHEAEAPADMVALRAQYEQYPAWNLSQMPNNFSSTTNYAYDVGDVRVIAVNHYAATSSDAVNVTGRVHEQVFNWIKNEIKATTKEHIIVMGHEPMYPVPSQTSGNHIGDSLDADPANRNRFVNLLASYGNVNHFVGHTHISDLYETRNNSTGEGDARNTTTILDGGIWELDTGAFGTKAARTGAAGNWPAVGYYHASSSSWGDYQIRLVQGTGSPDWAAPTVESSTIGDLTRQILVNTWEGAGTGTTTNGLFDMKYFVDYTAAVETDPDWSANNSGQWWEPAFDADTASWDAGELGVGYKTGGAAPGWINTPIDPYGGLSTTTNQVYSVMQRVTFPATSTDAYGDMTLHFDDDDGFMVWLNGTLIYNNTATVTAPTTGSGSEYFNKFQTSSSNNWSGSTSTPTFTEVDVSAYIGDLVNGENTLAIWNVNGGASQSAASQSSDIGVAVRLSISGVVDIAPPVISSVSSSTVTTNSANITWTTDEDSDSRVEYGLTGSYGSFTTLDTNLTTSHSVALTGLATSTLYHFRVISEDSSGNSSTSGDYTFVTPATTPATPTTLILREGVNSYSGMIDSYISSTATTTNYGTVSPLLIDGNAPIAGGLFKWDLSSIPTDSVITDAELVYYVTNASNTNTPYDSYNIFRSLRPWTEAGVTWNTYDGSNSWGTAGSSNTTTDYDSTELGPMGGNSVNALATSTLNQDGIDVVQGWVDGSITNNGFFIGDTVISTDGVQIVSSEGVTSSQRPALIITYEPPSGPDVTAPTISSVASSTTATTATITWTTDESADSLVDYGSTLSYGSASSSVSLQTSHSITISNLATSTEYHFRITSEDSSGNIATSTDYTLTTIASDPVTVYLREGESGYSGMIDTQIDSVLPTTNYGTATTTLVDGDTTSSSALLKWDLSTIPSDSTVTDVKYTHYVTALTAENFNMYQSLRPWTEGGATWNTYDGSNSWGTAGSRNTSSDYDSQSLATITGPTANAFATSTLNSSGVSVVQGWIDGSIDNNGFIIADPVHTDGYRYVTSEGATSGQRPLLTVTYQPSNGPDTTAPSISSIASSTTNTTATITWTTNEAATSTLNYGTTSSYGTATSSASLKTSHSYTLTGLSDSTTYHFQISVADNDGNVATSSDHTFETTVPDTTAPVISSVASSTSATTATITWTTNEASDTQVEYGTTSTYSASTTLDATATTTHSAVISGLTANTAYHFRVLSTDASDNLATSSDATFATAVSNGIAFQSIIDMGDQGVSGKATNVQHVMNYGPMDGASTTTIKMSDGTSTGITMSYSGTALEENGGAEEGNVAENGTTGTRSTPVHPPMGTDAYDEFGTNVNVASLAGGGTNGSNLSVNLSGLDTSKLYTLVAYGVRGKYNDRWCKYQLTGASSFTNESSSGTVATTTSVAGDSNIFLCGGNYATGYVVKWVDIDPSATSLSIVITSPAYNGEIAAKPYISALKIIEQEPVSDTTGPVISSIAADPDDSGASVTWTTDEAATSLVEYGTTASYGSSSALNSTPTTSHSRTISGLSPSTLYHYRVVSEDGSTNSTVSSDGTFTTDAAPDTLAPVISSIASSTSATTATISWTTDEAATSTINYGATSSYGTSTTSPTLVTSHGTVLSGLSPSTAYHFQISVGDAAGNIATSTDLVFTTSAAPDTTPPVISSVASTTNPTTATITWTTNEAATSTVEYGATSSYGSNVTSSDLVTSHSLEITGLTIDTTYHFRVSSTDSSSNRATSTDYTFTTMPDTTGPVISAQLVSAADDSATLTWSTDESASSRVQFGLTTTYASTTAEADTSPRVTSHTYVLTGLSVCTTYQYRVIGLDASLNSSTSTNGSFTTTGCQGGASVEASASEDMDTTTGGTDSLTSGGVTIEIDVPVGFAATDAVFQIKKIDGEGLISAVGSVSGKTAAENLVFDLKAYEDDETLITTFLNPITVTLTYDGDDVDALEESSLVIYRYDGAAWVALDSCTVNASANTVTCTTTHFTTFGIFGDEAERSSGGGGGGSKKKKTVAVATPSPASPTVPNATPVSAGYVFTRDLQVGAVGTDVMELQKYLNRSGFTVSVTGAGSVGFETETFGPATKAALIRFQDANAQYVLAPAGLASGTGYFGSLTRNFIHGSAPSVAPGVTSPAAPVVPVTVSPAVPSSQTFSRQLDLGDTGEDVRALQVFLNARGFAVAQAGPGAPGSETTVYGYATQAAVKRFQEAYANEILTPNGFAKGTGQFGPATMRKVAELLSAGL